MLKPVLAGLAISSLCLALVADLRAQSGGNTRATGAADSRPSGAPKKSSGMKSQIKKVQAEEETDPARRDPSDEDLADEPDAGQQTPRGGSKPARPAPLPTVRIPKLSPEVEKVLKDWELHTSQFQTMTVEFSRFTYDRVFEVEKRAEGTVAYKAPDRGNYVISGAKIARGEKSKKKNKNGVPYELKSDDPERWVCNGKEVIQINEKVKPPTYEKVTIPPESQGQNIIDGPLPFLFGMKAERAKSRYRDIKLLKSDEGEIWLQVRSFEEQDSNAWETAVIIIDAAKYVPKAVKLKDITGKETVHVFKNVVLNQKKGIFDKDPFNPNLKGYKQIIHPDVSKSSQPPAARGRSAADNASDMDRADSIAGSPSSKKSAGGARK
jgi:TIGR03009 family protein